MFEKLTPRRQNMLRYIAQYTREKKYGPSVREIQAALSIGSTSTVSADLHALIDSGFLRMEKGAYRSMQLVESRLCEYMPPETERSNANEPRPAAAREDVLEIPRYGDVAAGLPIYADNYVEDTVPLPSSFFQVGQDYFILTISGDSMIEAGILDGDHVLIRRQNTARNGDQVVALIEDSATVKTFFQRDGYVELRPENSSMNSILVRECRILGVVSGLYRLY
ncbi:MAG: transcriptional repressor LexA [Ndongobacter sp.]|nr:transcriptional repressor LexA [Ndongobacter sp.]